MHFKVIILVWTTDVSYICSSKIHQNSEKEFVNVMSKCTLKAKVFVIVTSFAKDIDVRNEQRHKYLKRLEHIRRWLASGNIFSIYITLLLSSFLSLFFLFLSLVFLYLWLPVSLSLTLYQKYLTVFLFFCLTL